MKYMDSFKTKNKLFKIYKINKHEIYIFKKLHLKILEYTPKIYDFPYDYKRLKEDFDKESAIFLVYFNKRPVAFGFVYAFKNKNEFTENFRKYSKIPFKDINLTAELAGCGVLKNYRGLGLQNYLIRFRENYLKSIGFKYSVISTHPDNIYSKNNILNQNYKLISTIKTKTKTRDYFKKKIF
jgi:ribosomal protein S18 acetylase RimI-like enzyme